MSETVKKRKKSTRKKGEEQKKSKKKKIIIIICILLVIIAAIVIYLLTRPKERMTEGNYKQIMEDMENGVREGYFETYMNTEWTFPDGTSAILGNSPNNKKPIRCEILLADTEEVIFETDVLPVGAEMPPFKLDVDLDAGTYDAVCMVYLLNEEDDGSYTDYSNAGFNITITVEN